MASSAPREHLLAPRPAQARAPGAPTAATAPASPRGGRPAGPGRAGSRGRRRRRTASVAARSPARLLEEHVVERAVAASTARRGAGPGRRRRRARASKAASPCAGVDVDAGARRPAVPVTPRPAAPGPGRRRRRRRAADLDPHDAGGLHQLVDRARRAPAARRRSSRRGRTRAGRRRAGGWRGSTEMPKPARRPTSSSISSRPSGSSPAVGSSSSTSSGSATSAWASLVRWRMPVENPPTGRNRASSRPDQVEHVGRPLAGGPGGQPGQLAEGGHDVGRGLVERQAVVLGHVAEPAADADGIGGHVAPGRPRASPPSAASARASAGTAWSCRHRWRRPDPPSRGHVDGQPGQRGGPVGVGHGEAGGAQHRGRGEAASGRSLAHRRSGPAAPVGPRGDRDRWAPHRRSDTSVPEREWCEVRRPRAVLFEADQAQHALLRRQPRRRGGAAIRRAVWSLRRASSRSGEPTRAVSRGRSARRLNPGDPAS